MMAVPVQMGMEELRELLRRRAPQFWQQVSERSWSGATPFTELLALSTLRRRAKAQGWSPQLKGTVRLALVGGCNLYPLHEMVEHLLETAGWDVRLYVGRYDNYVAEILEPESALYAFQPQVLFLLPALRCCRYAGQWTDAAEKVRAEAARLAHQLLELCQTAHERTHAEILLANFPLPAGFDPGPYRSRTLASDWSFRKLVNLELGAAAPPCVSICDLEFLACRRGTAACEDARAWYESKLPGSPEFLADIAREVVRMVEALWRSPKKVLVLDLDNTIWGGVVGDDGLAGIEIGDTSPRGEAFKAFQKKVLSLLERGVLLAVCSKNDADKAREPFEKHPDMVLRPEHIVSFKANWDPKSENLRAIAAELNLGLDSFVFVDDNPAEIEIVRRFVPEVSTILLGPDPADYVRQLEDARHFEPRALTAEDGTRTAQYRQEAERRALLESVTDMDAYLKSLEMRAIVSDFNATDAPRIAQLINKSNQFNLTTRRRTEAEVRALLQDPSYVCFSLRLADRFGDHGLIAVVIGRLQEDGLEVDTWLMSCRVLKRQVEEETLNELVRQALARGCRWIRGVYLPTEKNGMVRDLYPRLGFCPERVTQTRAEYLLETQSYQPIATHITVERRVS